MVIIITDKRSGNQMIITIIKDEKPGNRMLMTIITDKSLVTEWS